MKSSLQSIGLFTALVAVFMAWFYFVTPTPVPGKQTEAIPAKEVKNVPKETIQLPAGIKVRKPAAKAAVGLPTAIVEDESKHVIDAVTLPDDGHKHTAIIVLDDKTGEVTITDKIEPLPWLAAVDEMEIRLDYGIKNTGTAWRLSAEKNFVQIKQFRLGGSASIYTDGSWFAGVGVGWRCC